jgi:hypothetical protein
MTISGFLRWQRAREQPNFKVMRRVRDGEPFAGALIALGDREGHMCAFVISDSRTMGIHIVQLEERHLNMIRQLSLQISSLSGMLGHGRYVLRSRSAGLPVCPRVTVTVPDRPSHRARRGHDPVTRRSRRPVWPVRHKPHPQVGATQLSDPVLTLVPPTLRGDNVGSSVGSPRPVAEQSLLVTPRQRALSRRACRRRDFAAGEGRSREAAGPAGHAAPGWWC